MSRSLIVSSSLAAIFVAATVASAQTMVTLEGAYPSAGEFTIHPPNTCSYPTPDHFVWYLPNPAWPCGSIAGFFVPPVSDVGDVALDKVNDITWATDGLWLSGYSGGNVISGVSLAGVLSNPITGLGFDSENGLLWITDGFDAEAVLPPSLGCPALSAPVIGPISLPLGGTQALDIEWDSWSDSLWVSDSSGAVINVTVGGSLGAGGIFVPLACGFTGGKLTGITFDTCTGTLWVTDGLVMANFQTTGTTAAPTFYAPNGPCCSPPPPGPPSPMCGLGFAPRPQRYGANCATIGTPPTIGWTGAFSTSPNPAFGVTLAGAVPGSPTALLIGLGAPCPGIPWGVCEVLVSPLVFLLTTTTDANGDASFALPIPTFTAGAPPIGTTVMAQWLVLPSGGGRQSTTGLSFTLSSL